MGFPGLFVHSTQMTQDSSAAVSSHFTGLPTVQVCVPQESQTPMTTVWWATQVFNAEKLAKKNLSS